ncbi:MAG: hypothetical protein M3P49_16180, partial [Actinomycetota bacterium]|nr:hypothetical protein [Actinomycetota bacterium]
ILIALLQRPSVGGVVATGPEQVILTRATYRKVTSTVPVERVVTVLAIEPVFGAAEQFVRAGVPERRVVARVRLGAVRVRRPYVVVRPLVSLECLGVCNARRGYY